MDLPTNEPFQGIWTPGFDGSRLGGRRWVERSEPAQQVAKPTNPLGDAILNVRCKMADGSARHPDTLNPNS